VYFGWYGDRDVLHAAEAFGCGFEAKAREVKEPEQGVVAQVEEEVGRPRVVAVLDQLDQRKPEQALVERDGLLDVAADQRGVMDAATVRRWSNAGWDDVVAPKIRAPLLESGLFGIIRWGHATSVPPVSVVDISGVDLWFADGPHVLRDVSLTVRSGEHWALLGPNGAGKSTLLSLAAAQRFPSRGSVEVLGHTLGRVDLRELRKLVGIVDVRLRMPSELSVAGYVETGFTQTVQRLGPVDAEIGRRALEVMTQLGLAAITDRSVAVCSQGERARARLARALVSRPALLLLDEPAAGLDLPGRADLLAAMETAASQPSLTTVTVVHHLEELPATTSHVALLRDGRLVSRGDMALLGDSAALSECFGRRVRAFTIDGHWFATAS
jgi:iron complex transport system ATP-binding protein